MNKTQMRALLAQEIFIRRLERFEPRPTEEETEAALDMESGLAFTAAEIHLGDAQNWEEVDHDEELLAQKRDRAREEKVSRAANGKHAPKAMPAGPIVSKAADG